MSRSQTRPVFQSRLGALLLWGVVLLIAPRAIAQQPSLIHRLADGKPWSLVQNDGTTGQIALFPDGKATMTIGSRTLAPTWRTNGAGQLCLQPLPVVPERCIDLKPDGAAILGARNARIEFRLFR